MFFGDFRIRSGKNGGGRSVYIKERVSLKNKVGKLPAPVTLQLLMCWFSGRRMRDLLCWPAPLTACWQTTQCIYSQFVKEGTEIPT